MSGYNPATPPQQLNWFQRWRVRRRHKKAERKRTWMKLLAGFMVPEQDRLAMMEFIDSMSDEDVLCKAGEESYRLYGK